MCFKRKIWCACPWKERVVGADFDLIGVLTHLHVPCWSLYPQLLP
jgi:hypothetical protein